MLKKLRVAAAGDAVGIDRGTTGCAIGGGAGGTTIGGGGAARALVPKTDVRKENRDASFTASSARMLMSERIRTGPRAQPVCPGVRLSLQSRRHNGVILRMAVEPFTHLLERFPFEGVDENVVFNAERHEYHVLGTKVSRSCTAVVSAAIGDEPFDPDRVVDAYLASWRRNARSKYHKLVKGLSDADAAAAIKNVWNDANRLGTRLHLRLEAFLNRAPLADDGETDLEWPALARAVEGVQTAGWTPIRTELSLWFEKDGVATVAGQLDALFRDERGQPVIVDLKRTDKALGGDHLPWKCKTCAADVLSEHLATDFTKYSLQTSVYCVMLKQRTGIAVAPTSRWLLQAHPKLKDAKWTRCADLDAQAESLMRAL